jgi:hypothetical protein
VLILLWLVLSALKFFFFFKPVWLFYFGIVLIVCAWALLFSSWRVGTSFQAILIGLAALRSSTLASSLSIAAGFFLSSTKFTSGTLAFKALPYFLVWTSALWYSC